MKPGRLLLAGLVTGLVMNIGEAVLHGALLAESARSAYAALHLTAVDDPIYLVSLLAVTFAQGILMAWLYSVLRPRFGSRSTAAVCVGLVAWFLSSVYAAAYLYSGFPGILPAKLIWAPVAWQLIEYPLAMFAGAAVTKEATLSFPRE